MPGPATEALLRLMDDAFEGDRQHSVMGNLRNVGDDEWLWIPAGGGRTIHYLVQHVGAGKYMYENHAFGDASMRWEDEIVADPATARPMAEAIEWLREGHRHLVASVGALAGDAELARLRPVNWGERLPTREIVRIMILHDGYHAGEINHIRALAQGNDRWPSYG